MYKQSYKTHVLHSQDRSKTTHKKKEIVFFDTSQVIRTYQNLICIIERLSAGTIHCFFTPICIQ